MSWADLSSSVPIPAALVYKGTWAPTATAPAPAGGLKAGFVYALSPTGVLDMSWTGIGGVSATDGQLAIWEGSKWELLGDAGSVPHASETTSGIVELATIAETTAGTDTTRAVHPAALRVELDKKLSLTGGVLTGSVTTPERTITAAAFDLATGPYWTCGAIAIPNPTNAVAGMSGLIRLTAAPTGWGTHFKTPSAVSVVPAIVPFYVESATIIRLGKAVGVA